jgi:hypothetical protein
MLENRVLQARITQLQHENAELTARTGQLEGALKEISKIAPPPDKVNTQGMKLDKIYDIAQQAVEGKGEGVYKDWCRDPALCQDKGTCPKDPTCAD